MKLGHSEKGRKGVYGLGSLWRVVWGMEIGVIGITGGVNLRANFSPSVEINNKVWKNVPSVVSCLRL